MSYFKEYELFKIKKDKKIIKKRYIELIEYDINEIIGLFNKLKKDINKKSDLKNFIKKKNNL